MPVGRCWRMAISMIPELRLTLAADDFDLATRLRQRLTVAKLEVANLLRYYLIEDQEVVDENQLVWGEPQLDPDGQRGRIEVGFTYRASLGCQDREYSDSTRLPLFFEFVPGDVLRLFGPEIPEPASTWEEF